jgi:hypothetical protein
MHTNTHPTHPHTCLADTLVVAVSLVSSFGSSDSDGIKSIRLVRVARAVRLVGRFRSLRAILDALTQSIFPVLSASIVCVMTMSIFAILGVEFFKDSSPTYFGDFGDYVIYAPVCLPFLCLCVRASVGLFLLVTHSNTQSRARTHTQGSRCLPSSRQLQWKIGLRLPLR